MLSHVHGACDLSISSPLGRGQRVADVMNTTTERVIFLASERTKTALEDLPAKLRKEGLTARSIEDPPTPAYWLGRQVAYDEAAQLLEAAIAEAPAAVCDVAALEALEQFARQKRDNWQGFANPTEVQANTDITQIWQRIAALAPAPAPVEHEGSRAGGA